MEVVGYLFIIVDDKFCGYFHHCGPIGRVYNFTLINGLKRKIMVEKYEL